MKKVSLILTTYNNIKYLQETLKSIQAQDYPNIEVIIKDGGSTDGTYEYIQKFADDNSNNNSNLDVKYVSASDTGIYDAMNQGVLMSTGDILACFNDEFMCDDAISKYVEAIEKINPRTNMPYDGVHSDLVYAENGKVIRTWKMGRGKIHSGWMPGHPTLYLRREIYDKYGLYDTHYRIAADYEFMLRFLSDGIVLNYIPETLISMYYSGTSTSSLKSYIESFREGIYALKKNKIRFPYIVNILRTFRVLFQFVRK